MMNIKTIAFGFASALYAMGIAVATTENVQFDRLFVVDANGDSQADIARQGYNADAQHEFTFDVNKPTTRRWKNGHLLLNWSGDQTKWLLGDFNGDNQTDWLLQALEEKGPSSVVLTQTDVNLNSVQQTIPYLHLGMQWDANHHDIVVGDFDGDFRDDVFLQGKLDSDRHALALASTDGRFESLAFDFDDQHLGFDWRASEHQLIAGQFDGDGKTDLFLQGSQTASHGFVVSSENKLLNKNSQTFDDGTLGLNFSREKALIVAGDFDGNGIDDLFVLRAGETAHPFIRVKDGALDGVAGNINQLETTQIKQLLVGDFNADGVDEIVALFYGHTAPKLLQLSDKADSASITALLRKSGLLAGSDNLQTVTADLISLSTLNASLPTTQNSLANTQSNTTTMAVAPIETAALMAAANKTPTGATTVYGARLKASAGVSGGTATYNVAIDVPPGINSVQPAISLNYDSNAHNGLLGRGWSLSAGGAIARCASVYDIDYDGVNGVDNVSRPVQMDASDKLCLDGQPLIRVSGSTYGQVGAVYRTELESFVIVTQNGGDLANTSTWFDVEILSTGAHHKYGSTADSRAIPGGLTATESWQLAWEYDLSNNNVSYEYETLEGVTRLKTIYYTGRGTGTSTTERGNRSVQFQYEDRNDRYKTYLAGGYRFQSFRLGAISTWVGSTEVARYLLNYKSVDETTLTQTTECNVDEEYDKYSGEPLPSSCLETLQVARISLLDSIQHCRNKSGNWYCLSATQFAWNEYKYSTSNSVLANTPGIEQYDSKLVNMNVDLDGDAKPDIINYDKIFLSTQSYNTANPLSQANAGGDSVRRFITLDYNLDGRQDLAFSKYDSVTGKRFLTFTTWNGSTFVDSQSSTIDVTCQHFNRYMINPEPGIDPLHTSLNCYSFPLDANGDGKTDLIIERRIDNGNGSTTDDQYFQLLINESNGTDNDVHFRLAGDPLLMSFYVATYYAFADYSTFQVRDDDGDGVPNLYGIEFDGFTREEAKGRYVTVSVVKNGNDYTLQKQTTQSDVLSPSSATAGDFNGDGLTDRVVVENEQHIMQLNAGGGQSALAATLGDSQTYINTYWGYMGFEIAGQPTADNVNAYDYLRVLDYNHDGLDDFMVPTALETANVAICVGTAQQCQSQGLKQKDYDLYTWTIYQSRIKPDGTLTFVSLPGVKIVAPLTDLNVADFNGDGFVDIATRYGRNSGVWKMSGTYQKAIYVWYNANKKADLIDTITDGLGNTAQFDYVALTEAADVRTNATALAWRPDYQLGKFPYLPMLDSTRVVKSLTLSNAVGGTNLSEFRYRDSVIHTQGRGLQGFDIIEEIDKAKGLFTYSNYLQVFPYSGMLKSSYSNAGTANGGVKITETNNTEAVIRPFPDDRTYYPYIRINEQKQRDLNDVSDNTLNKKTTTVVLDDYANPELTTQSVVDRLVTHTTETDPTFIPDTAARWYNKSEANTTRRCLGATTCASDPKALTTLITNWDLARRLPKTVLTAGTLQTDYVYDLFGHVTSTTISGGSGITALAARTNSTIFQSDGYFPVNHKNALNQTVEVTHEPNLGLVTDTWDPLRNKVVTEYDAFGRQTKQQFFGQARLSHTPVISTYDPEPANGVSNAVYKVTVTQTGVKPTTTTWFDRRQRPLRTEVADVLNRNQVVAQQTQYDGLGHLTRQSVPFFTTINTSNAVDWTRYNNFDVLDRPTEKILPNGLSIAYAYNGARTTITVGGANGFSVYRDKNALGQWWTTEDQGSETTYDHAEKVLTQFRYDPQGNPISITRSYGNTTVSNTADYNVLGHKTTMTDPERGTWTFNYNVAGELVKQTDAKNQRTWFDVDLLGRVVARFENSVDTKPGSAVANWTYSSSCIPDYVAPSGSVPGDTGDALCSSSKLNEINKQFSYDKQGVLNRSDYSIGTKSFSVSQTVDAEDRPATITYPNSRLTQTNLYNAQGYLYAVQSGTTTLQSIQDVDAYGHVTLEQAGNGLYSKHQYNPQTGLIEGICVGASSCSFTGNGNVQSLSYSNYDIYGNLQTQINSVQGVTENFAYDKRQRLVQSKRQTTVANGFPLYEQTVNYRFDELGNLLQKDDFAATMLYTNVGKPHQVKDAKDASNNLIASYVYDNNGNLSSSTGQAQYARTLNYNYQLLPTSVIRGSNNSAFYYDENNERYLEQHVDGSKTIKIYKIGKLFEQTETTESGVTKTEERHYTVNGEYQYFTNTSCGNWRYFHTDRLGSIETITASNGTVLERHGFDPFGKARAGNWIIDSTNIAGAKGLFSKITTRGFTGHDSIDGVGLIHMNGRMYDPELGRFMQTDPFITSPLNAQTMNPYSYVNNNPIMGTDPTGYVSKNPFGFSGCGTTDPDCKTIILDGSSPQTRSTGSSNKAKPPLSQQVQKACRDIWGSGSACTVSFSNGAEITFVKGRGTSGAAGENRNTGGETERRGVGNDSSADAINNGPYLEDKGSVYKALTAKQLATVQALLLEGINLVKTTLAGIASGDEAVLNSFSQWTGLKQGTIDFVDGLGSFKLGLEGVLSTMIHWSKDLSLMRWSPSTSYFGKVHNPNDMREPVLLGVPFWSQGRTGKIETLIHEAGHYNSFSHEEMVPADVFSSLSASAKTASSRMDSMSLVSNTYIMSYINMGYQRK